jgi:hypothetical protein
VDSFGRTSLAWASMGLQAHMLDARGPHARSESNDLDDLDDDLDDLAHPLLAKQFAQGGKRSTFEHDVMILGARAWW